MIAIINYGLGNIRAFANVYKRLNIPFTIANKKEDLKLAKKIILPGVGAFDQAIMMLQNSGMKEHLEKLVLKEKTPVLGICVGMQMLGKSSEEGLLPGLDWIDGTVNKFNTSQINNRIRLPHMGWNTVKMTNTSELLSNLPTDAKFYFLHSYYFKCSRKENIITETEYGINFSSAINSGNIYGVQFHPEKSHENGIQVLKNFANL